MHVSAFRTWEALALGAIPIVLHSTMDRTYAGLPVLLIDDYRNLTVPMLRTHYMRFVSKASRWDFTRLTPGYWAGLVRHVAETGSSKAVQKKHPIPAGYKGDVKTPHYHNYTGPIPGGL